MRTLLASALVLLATPALAQDSGFMPYLGYNLDSENVVLGVGYRFGVNLNAPLTIVAQPGIEYQFTDADITVLQGDFNVVAEFSGSSAIAPYAGVGLGLLYVDSEFTEGDTELGLNILGGVLFNPTGFGQPFAQARYTTAGFDALTLQGGVVLSF